MATPLSWLDGLVFGIRRVYYDVVNVTTAAPDRPAIYVKGTVSVTDDPVNKATILEFTGGAGTVSTLSAEAPLDVNLDDPTHPVVTFNEPISDSQHGARSGGELHAVATTLQAGFMSETDKAKLDALGAGAAVVSVGVAPPMTLTGTSTAPVVNFQPAAAVAMFGYGFSACAGIDNSGAVCTMGGASTALALDSTTGVITWYRGAAAACVDTFHATGANTRVIAAGVSSWSQSWTADATAAGGSWTLEGQQGAAGFGGGSLIFKVGKGGTPGTDLAGNLDLEVGEMASHVSGKVRMLFGGVVGFTMGTIGGPTLSLQNTANAGGPTAGIEIRAVAGYVTIQAAVIATMQSDTGAVRLASSTGVVELYKANVLGRTDTFDPTAAQSIVPTVRTGTGANNGVDFDLKGQPGQAQSGGSANNNGGTTRLSSGVAGTGGAGAAGVDGDLVLRTGTTVAMTLAGDGSAATFARRVTAPRFVAPPSTPTSSAASLVIDLSLAQQPEHLITEATTVSFTNVLPGMKGDLVFRQGATGYALTFPANGSGVEYSTTILALWAGNTIVDQTAGYRTVISYCVVASPSTRVFFSNRAISQLP